MPKTEDDKGSKIKWEFSEPPVSPKPSSKPVPPFPIKPEPASSSQPQVESTVSQTSTQTRRSDAPETNPAASADAQTEDSSAETSATTPPTTESGFTHFLATGGVSLALLLCIGLIFSLGFLLWHSMQRQNSLENTFLDSERRQASAMTSLKEDVVKEVRGTRELVQERIQTIDQSQVALQKKIIDSERKAAELQEQIDSLNRNFIQEKQARENEMNLLLNLTRVRINNIEKRQQELEKTAETKNNR